MTWQFFHPTDRELESLEVGTFFYRPRVPLAVDDTQNPRWLDYEAFEPVVEQRVVPNAFFAFAPSERSFHGNACMESPCISSPL